MNTAYSNNQDPLFTPVPEQSDDKKINDMLFEQTESTSVVGVKWKSKSNKSPSVQSFPIYTQFKDDNTFKEELENICTLRNKKDPFLKTRKSNAAEVLLKIYQCINKNIKELENRDIKEKIDQHVEYIFGQADTKKLFNFAALKEDIIKKNVLQIYLQQMVRLCAKNDYMMHCIEGVAKSLKTDKNIEVTNLLSSIQDKKSDMGKTICDSVLLGVVLEHITTIVAKSRENLIDYAEALSLSTNIWSQFIDNLKKHIKDPAKAIKFTLIHYPLLQLVEGAKKGKVNEDLGKQELFWNMFVMIFADPTKDNFYSTMALCNTDITKTIFDNLEVSSKAFMHVDVGASEFAKMYMMWNFILMSGMSEEKGMYSVMKLLTPAVADFEKKPETYMFMRLIALSAYAQWNGNATGHVHGPELKELAKLISFYNQDNLREYKKDKNYKEKSICVWITTQIYRCFCTKNKYQESNKKFD